MRYRAEIDGLRSIAVIPVVLFHAGFEAFSGGFVGVDVFFVISGYLITSILLAELEETGTLSIRNFYERRARRILPALLTVIAFSSIAAFFVLLPNEFEEFSRSGMAAILFVSNIYFAIERDYFAGAAELEPLLHTWSLAVEEQYYILAPALTLFLWRAGYRVFVSTVSVFMALSFVLATVLVYRNPEFAFYNLATRAWELQAGALCAIVLRQRGPVSKPLIAAFGLIAILLSVFLIDKNTPYPSHYTLLPVMGTVCIILCCSGQDIVSKILSMPILVGIGLISYSTYLWHQPVFAFARHSQLESIGTPQTLGLIALSLALSFASWKLIEQPFRSRRKISTKVVVKSVTSAAAFFLVIFGAVAAFPNQYEKIWLLAQDKQTRKTVTVLEAARKNAELHAERQATNSPLSCRFNARSFKQSTKQRILKCYEAKGQGIVALGDSHASNLFDMLTFREDLPFVVGITRGGCRANRPNAYCSYEDFLAFVAEHSNVFSVVIYEQAGFYLLQNEHGKQADRYTFASVGMAEEISGLHPHRENIRGVMEYLDKLAKNTRTVWFGPRTEPHITRKMILKSGCEFSFQPRKGQQETFRSLDKYIEKQSSERTFEYISQIEMVSLQFPQDFMNCDETFWLDGDHYSIDGSKRFGKRISIDFDQNR